MDKTKEYCQYLLDFYLFVKPKNRGFIIKRHLQNFEHNTKFSTLEQKIKYLKFYIKRIISYKNNLDINHTLKSYEDFKIDERPKTLNKILNFI